MLKCDTLLVPYHPASFHPSFLFILPPRILSFFIVDLFSFRLVFISFSTFLLCHSLNKMELKYLAVSVVLCWEYGRLSRVSVALIASTATPGFRLEVLPGVWVAVRWLDHVSTWRQHWQQKVYRLPDVITEIDVIDRRHSNIQWRKN